MNAALMRRSLLPWVVLLIGASCDLNCGVFGSSGSTSSVNVIFHFEPEVACQGSTVTVTWDGAGVVPTITAPGGVVVSNGQSAGSGTFQATTSGNIAVSAAGRTKTFPFQVASSTTLNLAAPAKLSGSLYIGETPATFPAYDARFRATRLSTKRLQVLVSHASGSASVGIDAPAVLSPPWPMNGVWYFGTGGEPTDSDSGPSIIGVTATLACGP